jgi:hypothetical protein
MSASNTMLVVFYVAGILVLSQLLRRISSGSRGVALVMMFGTSIYGFTPLMLGRTGILHSTVFAVIAAAIYMVTFTFTGVFLLNRRLIEAARHSIPRISAPPDSAAPPSSQG